MDKEDIDIKRKKKREREREIQRESERDRQTEAVKNNVGSSIFFFSVWEVSTTPRRRKTAQKDQIYIFLSQLKNLNENCFKVNLPWC